MIQLVVVFAHELGVRSVLGQGLLEGVAHGVAVEVVLAEDGKVPILRPVLEEIRHGHVPLGGVAEGLECVAFEVLFIHEFVRKGETIHEGDFVHAGHVRYDLGQVAAGGTPDDVHLLFEAEPFGFLLRRSGLSLGVSLDDLDHLLFSVYEDTAPLVQVIGDPIDHGPKELTEPCGWSAQDLHISNLERVPGGLYDRVWIKAGHVGHLAWVEGRIYRKTRDRHAHYEESYNQKCYKHHTVHSTGLHRDLLFNCPKKVDLVKVLPASRSCLLCLPVFFQNPLRALKYGLDQRLPVGYTKYPADFNASPENQESRRPSDFEVSLEGREECFLRQNDL